MADGNVFPGALSAGDEKRFPALLMPDADLELPYEGAKEMIMVDEVENKEFLRELFDAMYPELPAPKKK